MIARRSWHQTPNADAQSICCPAFVRCTASPRALEGEMTASYGSDQHGLICGYAFDGTRGGRDIGLNDAVKWLAAHSLADDEGFLWLHFNLADASAERWIRTNSGAAGRILRVSACGVALDAHRTDWGHPDRRRQ